MQGQVFMDRVSADGVVEDENLDYEQSWWDGSFLNLKSYDNQGRVVNIRIRADLLMTELIGFGTPKEIVQGMPLDMQALNGRPMS